MPLIAVNWWHIVTIAVIRGALLAATLCTGQNSRSSTQVLTGPHNKLFNKQVGIRIWGGIFESLLSLHVELLRMHRSPVSTTLI